MIDLAGVCTGNGPCVSTPVGTGKNWVTKAGGDSQYVRAIVHALQRAGHSEQDAERLAHGIIERWAKGGGKVTPATRARAASAVAHWEAIRAKSHSHTAEAHMNTIDLAVLVAARKAAKAKGATLHGSMKYPTANEQQFKAAIRMVGMSKTPTPQVKAYLIARAKKMGWAVPKGWT
jgi:hypothetical protein